jgi:hypothetical protein
MFVASGIRFNDYVFTEPRPVADWVPPKYAGVYALLARDANWAPKPFQPLWFGEFGNNAHQHVFATQQFRLHKPEPLLVAVLAAPFSTTNQRCAIRDELIWAYNPVFQPVRSLNGPSELASKLREFEKRHEEQTTELRLLLASVSRLFGSDLEERPRRKPIGFLPTAEPSI